MVKVGDGQDSTVVINTASSVQSQDSMIVNSEAATLESDMGTMVINCDEHEDSTMKRKLSCHYYLVLHCGESRG